MPQPHWALKNIFYSVTATGVEIKVWTFQPCHLWLRWTLTYPQEHIIPVISRGVAIHSDKRFCFVNYHDNEQAEGDDTYIHTFLKEPWPHCETRFFYFHGRMGSERSRSTSAIFEYHRVKPALPVKQEYHESPLLRLTGMSQDGQMAQSFTPQADYAVSKLEVPMRGTTYPDGGIWHVQIRSNDVNHPAGTFLWEGTLNVADFPTPDYAWFELAVTGVNAQNGIPLWIVGFRTDYTYWWDYPSQASDVGDPYPRGEFLNRSTPISPWLGYGAGIDLGFRIWGI